MNNNNKIGIVTWHYYGNFGSALQSYATQEVLMELGYVPEFINYHNPKYGSTNKMRDVLKLCFNATLGHFYSKLRFGQLCFAHRYLREGQLTTNPDQLPNLSQKYNTII